MHGRFGGCAIFATQACYVYGVIFLLCAACEWMNGWVLCTCWLWCMCDPALCCCMEMWSEKFVAEKREDAGQYNGRNGIHISIFMIRWDGNGCRMTAKRRDWGLQTARRSIQANTKWMQRARTQCWHSFSCRTAFTDFPFFVFFGGQRGRENGQDKCSFSFLLRRAKISAEAADIHEARSSLCAFSILRGR